MEITQLPVPFTLWYWDHYCDGYECHSYMVYDQQSEYGYSRSEYSNTHGDIVHSEVKAWMIENISNDDILKLLDKWVGDIKAIAERYNEYYLQTKKEIELIKTEV